MNTVAIIAVRIVAAVCLCWITVTIAHLLSDIVLLMSIGSDCCAYCIILSVV